MKFQFLTEKENKILEYLEIKSVEEIFYLFPRRYNAPGKAKLIQDVISGENVSISGIVLDIDQKAGYYNKGLKYTKAIIVDETDSIEVVWWNMPYVANQLKVDQKIILTGIVENKNGKNVLPKFWGKTIGFKSKLFIIFIFHISSDHLFNRQET
jgi:ATP-dependent DNA helicase RecG